MKQYSGSIKKYFNEHPPHSISKATAKIEELTAIKRGETQVRKFLKDSGFRFRKVGTVPAKALTEEKNEQRIFLDQELNPRLAEAKSGKRVVYFADAVRFIHVHLLLVYGAWREFSCRLLPVVTDTMF